MKVSFDDLRVSTLFNDLDLMVKKIGFELTKKSRNDMNNYVLRKILLFT